MTDEGYACDGCGKEDCHGHNEYLYGKRWLTQDEIDEYEDAGIEIEDSCDDERWICGETNEPAKMHMIWSTEDRR